jgi:broad specificity phosphatase PhoE
VDAPDDGGAPRARGRVVWLARHGETDWNREERWQGHTDIALNDVGRAQARALAERLRGRGITRIHASDLRRARETAEIVAATLGGSDVVVDPGLRERSFGLFEGLTRLECEQLHAAHWASYRSAARRMPPGAEAQDALVVRMQDAIARAVAAAAGTDGAVLVVSHGGAIRALVAHATGVLPPPLENVALLRAVATDHGLVDIAPVSA